MGAGYSKLAELGGLLGRTRWPRRPSKRPLQPHPPSRLPRRPPGRSHAHRRCRPGLLGRASSGRRDDVPEAQRDDSGSDQQQLTSANAPLFAGQSASTWPRQAKLAADGDWACLPAATSPRASSPPDGGVRANRPRSASVRSERPRPRRAGHSSVRRPALPRSQSRSNSPTWPSHTASTSMALPPTRIGHGKRAFQPSPPPASLRSTFPRRKVYEPRTARASRPRSGVDSGRSPSSPGSSSRPSRHTPASPIRCRNRATTRPARGDRRRTRSWIAPRAPSHRWPCGPAVE